MNAPTLCHKIELAVRACAGIVFVLIDEDERIIRSIQVVAASCKRRAVAYDVAEGFRSLSGEDGLPTGVLDPIKALEYIERATDGTVFLLKDAADWCNNAQYCSKLRNTCLRLKSSRRTIVVPCHDKSRVPPALLASADWIEAPPPSAEELADILQQLSRNQKCTITSVASEQTRLVSAVSGLTLAQTWHVFCEVLVESGELSVKSLPMIYAKRAGLIGHARALRFIPNADSGPDLGGAAYLKEWVRKHRAAFTPEGREYGLQAPKGVCLMGPPGTGKSLAAKTTAREFGFPLLELDAGALYGKLVGDSEAATREALACAEALAPCVVRFDEMEKGVAHGDHDGGTSSRVLGTILSWMQEHTTPVLLVATVNAIEHLPPELVRPGRFDAIFFMDLPTASARQSILATHLTRRGRDPAKLNLEKLAAASVGYTGAELAQAVEDALFNAFDEQRQLTAKDIALAIHQIKPQSKSHFEKMAQIRQWIEEGRVLPASMPEAESTSKEQIPLELMS